MTQTMPLLRVICSPYTGTWYSVILLEFRRDFWPTLAEICILWVLASLKDYQCYKAVNDSQWLNTSSMWLRKMNRENQCHLATDRGHQLNDVIFEQQLSWHVSSWADKWQTFSSHILVTYYQILTCTVSQKPVLCRGHTICNKSRTFSNLQC